MSIGINPISSNHQPVEGSHNQLHPVLKDGDPRDVKNDAHATKALNEAAVYDKHSKVHSAPSKDATYTVDSMRIKYAQNTPNHASQNLTVGEIAKEFIAQAKASTLATHLPESESAQKAVYQARLDISEGGYYSIKKTSERLLELLSADFDSQLHNDATTQLLLNRGCGEAQSIWEGRLPDICYATCHEVLNLLQAEKR